MYQKRPKPLQIHLREQTRLHSRQLTCQRHLRSNTPYRKRHRIWISRVLEYREMSTHTGLFGELLKTLAFHTSPTTTQQHGLCIRICGNAVLTKEMAGLALRFSRGEPRDSRIADVALLKDTPTWSTKLCWGFGGNGDRFGTRGAFVHFFR